MRWLILLIAVLMVNVASAEDKKPSQPATTTAAASEKTKKPKTMGGAKLPVSTGATQLSSNDCTNLQCSLVVMSSCTTHVGCDCQKGVTICVDEMSPE